MSPTTSLLLLIVYFIVGGAEWFLALKRISCQMKGQRYAVASIVFLEVILAFTVFDAFIISKSWYIIVVYALGCATGSLLVGDKRE